MYVHIYELRLIVHKRWLCFCTYECEYENVSVARPLSFVRRRQRVIAKSRRRQQQLGNCEATKSGNNLHTYCKML